MYNGVPISAVQQSDSVRHKKEQNNAICSNMDATIDYHTKWSKPKREETNIIRYHLYVESKEKKRYN